MSAGRDATFDALASLEHAMETRIEFGLEVLRRTSAFLLEDRTVRANLGTIARQAIALNEVIDRLAALNIRQERSDRGYHVTARQCQRRVRDLLKKHIRPISRIGRALFPENTPRGAAFRKSACEAFSYESRIAVAERIAECAAEREAEFFQAGLDVDFLDRLHEAVDALRESLDAKEAFEARRGSATARMIAEFTRGRRIVRVLDALVAPQLEGTDRLPRWRMITCFAQVADNGQEPRSSPATKRSVA